MKAVSRAVGDTLLGLFAVAVVAGSVLVIDRGNDSQVAGLTAQDPTSTGSPQPRATATSPAAASGRPTLVIAGPDLAKLREELASKTSDDISVVRSTATELIAAGALDDITGSPVAVVLEIVAGTKTSVRTAAAVAATRKRWPQTDIFVVGPFSSADRKSAAAAKAAAQEAKAIYLDPVDLKWRKVATSPRLSTADEAVVAEQLANAVL